MGESPTLRDYLQDNLFDGSEDGIITMPAKALLDSVCENVALWLIEQSGVSGAIENHFIVPRGPSAF